jgi:hypothetical protein
MARTEATLSACMITQQLDVANFTWSDEELEAITHRDAFAIATNIALRLYQNGMMAQEAYCIIHDKDTRIVHDDATGTDVIEQKASHFHCLIKFMRDPENPKTLWGGTLSQISLATGIQENYIEKPKRGKNAYDNMLAYLIHIKYPEKFQYDPHLVHSTGAIMKGVKQYREYMEYYNERKNDWIAGRAKIKVQQAKLSIDAIEEDILMGYITKEQILLSDNLYSVYARNKRRCDDAFDTFAQRKIARACRAMELGLFKTSVFYITGKSHAGKSHFTDGFVKKLQQDAKNILHEDWTVCSVASSNPLDDYDGSEILVMDDLRGIAMTASDWLKLLDPDRSSIVSARYHNKKIACRAIVINSEKDVREFFYYMKSAGGGDRSEALDQFYRRILAYIRVYRVPDDAEMRRVRIGQMQEVDPYRVPEPGCATSLQLHHDFNKDVQDMSCEDAQACLSELVILRDKRVVKGVADGSV